mmetsp:Transcript_44226/g.128715  ORF Transcript_44226/g.128715 Transcript_44226/m.128715 type:complete len:205 (+) Transcript_44226:57-671(+)
MRPVHFVNGVGWAPGHQRGGFRHIGECVALLPLQSIIRPRHGELERDQRASPAPRLQLQELHTVDAGGPRELDADPSLPGAALDAFGACRRAAPALRPPQRVLVAVHRVGHGEGRRGRAQEAFDSGRQRIFACSVVEILELLDAPRDHQLLDAGQSPSGREALVYRQILVVQTLVHVELQRLGRPEDMAAESVASPLRPHDAIV